MTVLLRPGSVGFFTRMKLGWEGFRPVHTGLHPRRPSCFRKTRAPGRFPHHQAEDAFRVTVKSRGGTGKDCRFPQSQPNGERDCESCSSVRLEWAPRTFLSL